MKDFKHFWHCNDVGLQVGIPPMSSGKPWKNAEKWLILNEVNRGVEKNFHLVEKSGLTRRNDHPI
jgi:hypothetical protein